MLFVLRHENEVVARSNYPGYAPQSTTILAFHKVDGTDERGRPQLVLERHGSLDVDAVRRMLDQFGLGLTRGVKAHARLALRRYASDGWAEVAA